MNNVNTFATESEYKEARRKHDIYDAASMEYCKAKKTNGIPKEVYTKFPYADEVDNDLRSKIEVWEFMHEKPVKYFLYINDAKQIATTWTGEFLGTVGYGNTWKSCFGDTRQSINVYGANGIVYHGIYYKSVENYARIKAFKN